MSEHEKYLKRMEDKRIAEPIYQLGLQNEFGKGVPQNPEKARDLYKEAGFYNHADAWYRIGMMWKYGIGGPQSDQWANDYFLRAALKLHPEAMKEHCKYFPSSPRC